MNNVARAPVPNRMRSNTVRMNIDDRRVLAIIDYAASDVLHLHALREKLNEMLERENRADLANECFKLKFEGHSSVFIETETYSITPKSLKKVLNCCLFLGISISNIYENKLKEKSDKLKETFLL